MARPAPAGEQCRPALRQPGEWCPHVLLEAFMLSSGGDTHATQPSLDLPDDTGGGPSVSRGGDGRGRRAVLDILQCSPSSLPPSPRRMFVLSGRFSNWK